MLKNFKNKFNKGVTLVELLVVIAIIGLLATISALVVYRYQRKSVDTRIEAEMSQVRSIAAMIYNDDMNYNALCDSAKTLNDSHPRHTGLKDIENDIVNFTGQNVVCYGLGFNYCVQSILVAGGSICVDGNGYAGSGETNCAEANKKCSNP